MTPLKSNKMVPVRVHFDNGDHINTNINGDMRAILDYYTVGREFNLGHGDEDLMAKVVACEFMEFQPPTMAEFIAANGPLTERQDQARFHIRNFCVGMTWQEMLIEMTIRAKEDPFRAVCIRQFCDEEHETPLLKKLRAENGER
jgi:hypothetical protein